MSRQIGVLGLGSLGGPLAELIHGCGNGILACDPQKERRLSLMGRCESHLPCPPLHLCEGIEPRRDEWSNWGRGLDFILVAVPTDNLEEALCNLPACDTPVVLTQKGIRTVADGLPIYPIDIARQTLGDERPILMFTGAGFGTDFEHGNTVGMIVAREPEHHELAQSFINLFANDPHRINPYTTAHPHAVAVRNAIRTVGSFQIGAADAVIPVKCESTRALVRTAILCENQRLAELLDPDCSKISVGAQIILRADQMLCISPGSRNYSFGFVLASNSGGFTTSEAVAQLSGRGTIECVKNIPALVRAARAAYAEYLILNLQSFETSFPYLFCAEQLLVRAMTARECDEYIRARAVNKYT